MSTENMHSMREIVSLAAGLIYEKEENKAYCDSCGLEVHHYNNDMNPLSIHVEQRPDCSLVLTALFSSLVTTDGQLSRSNGHAYCHKQQSQVSIHSSCMGNILFENDFLKKIQASTFSNWSKHNNSLISPMIDAGFFNCMVGDRVICLYCNLICQQWTSSTNSPWEIHKTFSPNCPYVIRKSSGYACSSESIVNQNQMGVSSVDSLTASNNEQLCNDNESVALRRSLDALLKKLSASENGLNLDFKISTIKRFWNNRLRVQHRDDTHDCDLYMICYILQKQLQIINGNKEKIIILGSSMENVRDQRVNKSNFREHIETTIRREQSLADWSHRSPSRIKILLGGWSKLDKKPGDHTECLLCGVKKSDWDVNDNPLNIHRILSPSCQFCLSSNPMHTSCVKKTRAIDYFTPEHIAHSFRQPNPILLPVSNSEYRLPPKRRDSFENFPINSPIHIEEIVRSGFYYFGEGTLVRCYHCQGVLNDIHMRPLDDIHAQHRRSFPNCTYAACLPSQVNLPNTADQCQWCYKNPSKIIAYPCSHLAICDSCSDLIHLCPKCFKKPCVFLKLYV